MAKLAWILLILFGVLVMIGISAQDDETPEARGKTNCSSEGRRSAWYVSQEFVERNLRAPKTAEFPSFGSDRTAVRHLGGCRFDVVGYVDAQNGFGALIRSVFTLEVEYEAANDLWRSKNVTIQ